MSARPRPILICALLVGGLALAAAAPRDDGAVHDAMEGIKVHLKSVAASIGDPEQRDATLAGLADMQQLFLEAKQATPPALDTLPRDQRDEHVMAFRLSMNRTLAMVLDIEAHVLAGEYAAASGKLRGPLLELRNAAHDRFQPPLVEEEQQR